MNDTITIRDERRYALKEERNREEDKQNFSFIDSYASFNDISFYCSLSCDIYDILYNKTKIRFILFLNCSYL